MERQQSRPQTMALLFARIAGATAAGLGLSVALSPYDYHAVAPIAFAVFILSIWRAGLITTSLLTGWCCLVFFSPVMWWLTIVGTEAWIFPIVAYGVFALPAGVILYFVTRVALWPIWVSSVWVFRESLADRYPFGGFGWGQLGYSQIDTPLAAYASWGGAQLVTFMTCLVGAMLAYIVIWIANYAVNREGKPYRLAAAPAVAAAVGIVALSIPLPVEGETAEGPASALVTIVQAGAGDIEGIDPSLRELNNKLAANIQITRDYAFQTREGSEPTPDFVVWPENAADGALLSFPKADLEMQKTVDYLARPILAGSSVYLGEAGWVNGSLLWLPEEGPVDFYYKRHLVPFAEYIPLSGFIGNILNTFSLSQGFIPGTEPGFFDIDGVAVSTVICFEISSNRVLREAVLEGGRAIVLQSSNYGFIYLGQADQQFAIARLRAIEHGRSLIASGVSGPSGFIAPNGSVMKVMPEGDIGTISATIPLRDTLTIADRLGIWSEAFLALLWVVGVILYIRDRKVLARFLAFLRGLAPERESPA